MKSPLFAVLCLTLVLSVAIALHGTDDSVKYITGTVTSISEHSIILQSDDTGSPWVTIRLLPSTRFLEDTVEIPRSIVGDGNHLLVRAKLDNGNLDAVLVVSERPPAHENVKPSTEHQRRSYYCFLGHAEELVSAFRIAAS